MQNKNGKRIVIMGLAVVVLAVVILLVGNSVATSATQSKTEKVEGLLFENASVLYDSGYSTFTVDVYNEEKEVYKLKSIDIILVNENNDKVTLTYEISNLEVDEGRQIIIDMIDYDLSSYSNISYRINR